jgi:hypothetical protein
MKETWQFRFIGIALSPGSPAYRDLRQIRGSRNDDSVIAFPLAYEDNRNILGAVQDLLRNASDEEFGDA